MRSLLLVLLAIMISVFAAGCTWEELEKKTGLVQVGAGNAQRVGTLVSPIFGPYATLAATIAGAVGTIAGAINTLAKNKKIKALAQTASEAADKVQGGGQALVNSAVGNGVATDIKAAYDKLPAKKA